MRSIRWLTRRRSYIEFDFCVGLYKSVTHASSDMEGIPAIMQRLANLQNSTQRKILIILRDLSFLQYTGKRVLFQLWYEIQ